MTVKVVKDTERVAEIRKKLKENDGFCPCRLEQNEDTKCPCKEFRNQIEERKEGECHCGLYMVSLTDEK